MALYLYAFTDSPAMPLPAQAGLEGAPLRTITVRDIAAVTSSITTVPVPTIEDNFWHHEKIVEALMSDRTLLPVRFGTVVGDSSALVSLLTKHYTNLSSTLDRVRDHVELSVRVLWDKEHEQPPTTASPEEKSELNRSLSVTDRASATSGRAYLLARLEQQRQEGAWRRQAEALAAELHTPLAQLATESVQRTLVTPRMLLTGAYLVHRDHTAAFREEVAALGANRPVLQFLCTGPWPPYSFVTTAIPQAGL